MLLNVRARRAVSAGIGVVATTAAIAMAMVAPTTAPAGDAAQLMPTQPMFLSERISAADGPSHARYTSGALPEQMVTLRGEREGFQLAVQNTTGAGALGARVVGDAALQQAIRDGQIGFELLRVGFVDLPQGSTGMGTSGGSYADPLPPFNNDLDAGRLSIASGRWGGLVVLARVRTDAPSAVYSASVELFTGDSGNDTVQARQAFTLDVRAAQLRQPGDKNSFKTVTGVEGESYWLQHPDMRSAPRGTQLWANRMAQVTGLLSFLDSRDITPLEMPFANPAKNGTYSCSYQTNDRLPAFSYLDQLKDRYYGKTRDIDPNAAQFPVRFMPHETNGCKPDGATEKWEPTLDKLRTPGVKQDDVLNPAAPAWYRTVAATWNANSLWKTGATYAKNPFDEPGDASAAQRATMSKQVPAATVALHKASGGKALVVLAGWPRDSRSEPKCRKVGTGKSCTTVSGDTSDNRKMWDGKGQDDVDVWMPHFSRLWGRPDNPLLKKYSVDRKRWYADRLAKIRKLKGGRETWAYNFYTATKLMPQLAIDSPGTDPVVQTLMLARDGHTGLYVSNSMMGWGATIAYNSGTKLRRKGNPYEQAPYFYHKLFGYAAGWGTFIYPGYSPELGLVGEERRNSENAQPVSSLRLEGMREGTEDANLALMYRDQVGDNALQAKLKSIFPGAFVTYPKVLGTVVGPAYKDDASLAQRIETTRRAMIDGVG